MNVVRAAAGIRLTTLAVPLLAFGCRPSARPTVEGLSEGKGREEAGKTSEGLWREIIMERSVEGADLVSKGTKSALACMYYVCTSVLISGVNKAVLSTWKFSLPLFVLFLQSTATILIFFLLWVTGLIGELKRPARRTLLKVSLVYFVSMTTSLSAMNLTSLLMFNTLRRTSIVWVLFFEWVILRRTPSAAVIFSVAIIITGALVAGYKDLVFDAGG